MIIGPEILLFILFLFLISQSIFVFRVFVLILTCHSSFMTVSGFPILISDPSYMLWISYRPPRINFKFASVFAFESSTLKEDFHSLLEKIFAQGRLRLSPWASRRLKEDFDSLLEKIFPQVRLSFTPWEGRDESTLLIINFESLYSK